MAVGYEKYFWLFEPNQDLQVYLLRDCEGTSARLAAHMQLTSHASLLARSRGSRRGSIHVAAGPKNYGVVSGSSAKLCWNTLVHHPDGQSRLALHLPTRGMVRLDRDTH
jgi:hypothetical protein